VWAAIALVSTAGLLLTSCATNNSRAIALKACRDVDQSLRLVKMANIEPNPKKAASERARALNDLQIALPLASIAAGEDGQYQALMADLNESSKVPESILVPGLEQACQSVENPNSGGSPLPIPTTTVPLSPTLPNPVGN
jgi:hypothetical protein